MLAFARYRDSGGEMAAHALELLDYAAELNPSLDTIWGYRATILYEQGETASAREAAQTALEINAYCDMAMTVMDALG